MGDTGKVDVDGGWQVKKNPQKVSPAWCSVWLGRRSRVARAKGTELLPHARPRTAAGFRHHMEKKNLSKAKTARVWYVGVDDEKFTRPRSSSARPMRGNFQRLPCEVPRLETASGQRLMEVTCEKLATKERTEVREGEKRCVRDGRAVR